MCDVNVTMLYPTHGAEPDVLSHGAANRRVILANTRHSPRVVPMLGRRNGQWANIDHTMGECWTQLGYHDKNLRKIVILSLTSRHKTSNQWSTVYYAGPTLNQHQPI